MSTVAMLAESERLDPGEVQRCPWSSQRPSFGIEEWRATWDDSNMPEAIYCGLVTSKPFELLKIIRAAHHLYVNENTILCRSFSSEERSAFRRGEFSSNEPGIGSSSGIFPLYFRY